jgi:hypothetical protein
VNVARCVCRDSLDYRSYSESPNSEGLEPLKCSKEE